MQLRPYSRTPSSDWTSRKQKPDMKNEYNNSIKSQQQNNPTSTYVSTSKYTTLLLVALLFQLQVGSAAGLTVHPHIHVLRVCSAPSGAILGWLCIVTAAYQVSHSSKQRRQRCR